MILGFFTGSTDLEIATFIVVLIILALCVWPIVRR